MVEKMQYEAPEMEIIRFDPNDVIRTSSDIITEEG